MPGFNQTQWTSSPTSVNDTTAAPWTPPPHPDSTFDYYCNNLCELARNNVCEDQTALRDVIPDWNKPSECSSGTDCDDCGPVLPENFHPYDCSDGIDGNVMPLSAGQPCYFPWADVNSGVLFRTCGIPFRSARVPNTELHWCPTNPQGTSWASCTPYQCTYPTKSPTDASFAPTTATPSSMPSHNSTSMPVNASRDYFTELAFCFALGLGLTLLVVIAAHCSRPWYKPRGRVVNDEEYGMEMDYQDMHGGNNRGLMLS